MSKILITGSSGFIGYHLASRLLAQGHEITCLVRKSSNLERLSGMGICRAEGDVTDAGSLAAAVRGKDVVYHLAGAVKALQIKQLYRVNRDGVANIARACAESTTPPVLLMVSSLAAMGPSTPRRPRLASDTPAPVSHYGRSKLAGELEARRWATKVPITIVRPPVVFGEADPATYEIFKPIARLGIHVVPTWRTHRVSLIHADDLATELILAAERGKRIVGEPLDGEAAAQGCYFAAAERDLTFPRMGRMIGEALGRRRTLIWRLSPVAVWGAAYMATALSRLSGRSWYFNLDKAREACAGSWTCSNEAAVKELGCTVGAPLAERLRQTARWYIENKWL